MAIDRRVADTVVVVAAMATTAALALRNVDARSLWMDEGFSAYLVAGSNDRFLDRVLFEPQFVLYHAILRAWTLLGSSDFVLRSMSIAAAVLTIPVVHDLARRLFGRRAAAVAVVVLAVNGLFIGHAQEARPYALAAMTSAATSLCFVWALEEPDRTRRWLAWMVAGGAAMSSHPFGAFVVLTHVAVLVVRRRSIPWRRVAPIVALPTVAAGAMMLGLAFVGSTRIDWIPRTSLERMRLVSEELAGGRSALTLFAYAAATWISIVVLRQRAAERRRTTFAGGVEIALAFVLGPLALALLVSITQPVFLARYLIVVVPALAVLVGAGLGHARPSIAAGATAALVLISLHGALNPTRDELLQDWRSAATTVLALRSEGDLIVVTPVGHPTLQYYFDENRSTTPPPLAVDGERFVEGGMALEPCRLRTVWVVTVDYGSPEPVEAMLASTHARSGRWEVDGLVIARHERLGDAGPAVPLDERCP